MFRLWIVGTALFVTSVAFLGYRDVKEEFDELAILREFKGETVVPVLCGEARGVAGDDYTNNQEVCWYAISRFRVLYPEHNEQSEEELARKLYAVRGVDLHFPPPPKPWTTIWDLGKHRVRYPVSGAGSRGMLSVGLLAHRAAIKVRALGQSWSSPSYGSTVSSPQCNDAKCRYP
jgi:hypothetical protein